jgi:hypothetical protein
MNSLESAHRPIIWTYPISLSSEKIVAIIEEQLPLRTGTVVVSDNDSFLKFMFGFVDSTQIKK